MICQICKENPATIHVTEIQYKASSPAPDAPSAPSAPNAPNAPDSLDAGAPIEESQLVHKNLCDSCAQGMQLPYGQIETQKVHQNIWKLLQHSARKARQEGSLSCPDCGMTLAEFRAKGRLGCPRDYEVFRKHLQPLLQRVHNASEHRGRLPGLREVAAGDRDDAQGTPDRERDQHLTRLRSQLEEAIRAEAYENAARLRDEIQELESQSPKAG